MQSPVKFRNSKNDVLTEASYLQNIQATKCSDQTADMCFITKFFINRLN